MSVIALWDHPPRLMAVPGVVNVAIWASATNSIRFLSIPTALRANQVSLDQIVNRPKTPVALDGGGFLDTPNQRLAVQQAPRSSMPRSRSHRRLVQRGTPLRIGDVADVQIGSPAPIGDAIINDVPGLLLIVEKQPNANLLEVTRKVEAALDALKPASRISNSIQNLRPPRSSNRAIDNLNTP